MTKPNWVRNWTSLSWFRWMYVIEYLWTSPPEKQNSTYNNKRTPLRSKYWNWNCTSRATKWLMMTIRWKEQNYWIENSRIPNNRSLRSNSKLNRIMRSCHWYRSACSPHWRHMQTKLRSSRRSVKPCIRTLRMRFRREWRLRSWQLMHIHV